MAVLCCIVPLTLLQRLPARRELLLMVCLCCRLLPSPLMPLSRPSLPAAELRHPLCLVLLRNCASPYDQAVTAAVRLFEAILSAQVSGSQSGRAGQGRAESSVGEAGQVAQTLLLELWIGVQCRCCAWLCLRLPPLSCLTVPCPPWLPQKLRAGLKAELGALYPLLLLKPVEAAAPESAHSVVMAAEGLLHVCSHPQVRAAGLVEGMGRLQRAAAASAGHLLAALFAAFALPAVTVNPSCVTGVGP